MITSHLDVGPQVVIGAETPVLHSAPPKPKGASALVWLGVIAAGVLVLKSSQKPIKGRPIFL